MKKYVIIEDEPSHYNAINDFITKKGGFINIVDSHQRIKELISKAKECIEQIDFAFYTESIGKDISSIFSDADDEIIIFCDLGLYFDNPSEKAEQGFKFLETFLLKNSKLKELDNISVVICTEFSLKNISVDYKKISNEFPDIKFIYLFKNKGLYFKSIFFEDLDRILTELS